MQSVSSVRPMALRPLAPTTVPDAPAKAGGAKATVSKTAGTVVGAGSGVAVAGFIVMFGSWGRTLGPVGIAMAAGAVALGAALGFQGGGRIGEYLENKPIDQRYKAAGAIGGIGGTVFGAVAGASAAAWLGAGMAISPWLLLGAAPMAVVGALGGIALAKKTVDFLAKH